MKNVKMRLHQRKEFEDIEQLSLQILKEGNVVHHFETDLIIDLKRIFKEDEKNKTFYLYWITRRCGTFIFDAKSYELDEILRKMGDNYTYFNVYAIIKDNSGHYILSYIDKIDIRDSIK